MFSMISKSKEINKTGTGMGLFISKSLSQYLTPKGDKGIRIKSIYGIGSKFYFYLENKIREIVTPLVNLPK